MERLRTRFWLVSVCALLALLFTLALGLHGLGRPGSPQLDFLAYYGGGCRLLDHQSPYGFDPQTPTRMLEQGYTMRVYAYAPNMGPIVLALSLFKYDQALLAFNVVNVLAVIAFGLGAAALMLIGSKRGMHGELALDEDSLTKAALVCLVAWLPPYASHSLWFGNITALALALGTWAWWLDSRGHAGWAGVLFGIAALKPPLVILLGFWFLLQRRWVTLGVAFVVVLAMSLPAMSTFGPVTAWLDWIHGLKAYAATPENAPTGEGVIGLRSFLAVAGLSVPDLSILGVLFTFALWKYDRRLTPALSLAFLVAANLLFFDGHMPGLLGLAVVAGGWLELAGTGVWSLSLAAVALGAFIAPREALRILHAPEIVLRYRTPELLVVTLAMLWLLHKRRSKESAPLDAVAVTR